METVMTNAPQNDLALRAIRIAEHAHRKRPQGPHYRKAAEGQDRGLITSYISQRWHGCSQMQDAVTNS